MDNKNFDHENFDFYIEKQQYGDGVFIYSLGKKIEFYGNFDRDFLISGFTSDEDYQLGHNVLSPGKDPNYTKIVSALLKLFSGLKDHEWNKLKIERTLYKVLEDRFYVKSLLKMELK
jgi:hypothetical protein